jgi:hypothetical protein
MILLLMNWHCRPPSTDDMEQGAPAPAPDTEGQAAPDQAPVIEGEAQEREARSERPEVAGEQLGGGEQGRSGAGASADPSLGASGTEMGPALGAQASGSGATGAAQNPVEEGTEEIEEIPRPPEEEEVQPQRIRVARQRNNEWVFHKEDWSGASSRQIRRTLEKLYSQVQVP